jgi:hypothetical protein
MLAFAEDDLRSARHFPLFFFLVLHQIRTSHGFFAPAAPWSYLPGAVSRLCSTEGCAIRSAFFDGLIATFAIMSPMAGAVKLQAVRLCPKCNVELRRKNRQFPKRVSRMSAFNEHKEELEHYEQMFGRDRGRLAVTLDRLTNALVLVGQHGVYCTSQRNPTLPAMDLRMIVQELTHAKELLQAVMEEMRRPGQPS